MYNPNWPNIPGPPYGLLIMGGSRSGKINELLNLISCLSEINKIFSFTEDPYEPKYQLLINKHDQTGLKHFKDPKISLNIQMIWMVFLKIVLNRILKKNCKVLIVFDDIITVIMLL